MSCTGQSTNTSSLPFAAKSSCILSGSAGTSLVGYFCSGSTAWSLLPAPGATTCPAAYQGGVPVYPGLGPVCDYPSGYLS
jgi:hypothetical protein